MFIPNNTGMLSRRLSNNLYSEISYDTPIRVECGVVRMPVTAQQTSVRADSSASRGAADEITSNARILFTVNVSPQINDRFEIAGFKLRCVSREPRYSVAGILDHYECTFEATP